MKLETFLLRGRCQWTWTSDLDFPSGLKHPYKHTEDSRKLARSGNVIPSTVTLGDEMAKYVLEKVGEFPWDFYQSVPVATLQSLLVDSGVDGNYDYESEKNIWGE